MALLAAGRFGWIGTFTGVHAPVIGAIAGLVIGMLSVDLRDIAHRERHLLVLFTFKSLLPGEAMRLVNDHNPCSGSSGVACSALSNGMWWKADPSNGGCRSANRWKPSQPKARALAVAPAVAADHGLAEVDAMTSVATESCIRCNYTDCVDVCPVDAFREGPNFLVIDPDEYINCAVCVPECPVSAIYAEKTCPATSKTSHRSMPSSHEDGRPSPEPNLLCPTRTRGAR